MVPGVGLWVRSSALYSVHHQPPVDIINQIKLIQLSRSISAKICRSIYIRADVKFIEM